MRKAAKIAISLPVALLDAVERYREEHGVSRSEGIAQLLEAALRREREQADVERYIRGYLEQPETDEEIAISDRLSVQAASVDPWP